MLKMRILRIKFIISKLNIFKENQNLYMKSLHLLAILLLAITTIADSNDIYCNFLFTGLFILCRVRGRRAGM